MLLMLRAQKRLTITAGKMTDLSLEGFTNVGKPCVYAGSVLPNMLFKRYFVAPDHEVIRVVHIRVARVILEKAAPRGKVSI